MIKKKLPDFMPSISSTRQNLVKRNYYETYQNLAAIYLLRLALGLQKKLKRAQLYDFFEDELGSITGLDVCQPLNDDENKIDDVNGQEKVTFLINATKPVLLKLMRQRLKTLLDTGIETSESLFANIQLMSNTLKLSAVEQEILVFRLLIALLDVFRQTLITLCNSCSIESTVDYLRIMTTHPSRDIQIALEPKSQLLTMGWIKIHSSFVDLEDKLILADGLLDILLYPHTSAEALFANFFRPSERTKLVVKDYAHLQNHLDLLLAYLQVALKEKHKGVNVLIYGPPGVGKTQFAKLLAQSLHVSLYEVLCTNQEGNSLRGASRFAACNLSQKLLTNSQTSMLLFDEAEDVFPCKYDLFFDEEAEQHASSQGEKAWINQQLENNPVPIIWISNRIQGIDKAYLRRFSYSLEIDKMPVTIRRRIVNKYSKDLQVTAEWRENLAIQSQLTPAQIEQACLIAKFASQKTKIQTEKIADQVLQASMRLLKQKNIKKQSTWTQYDSKFTNIDRDLDTLLMGLKQNPRGSFCFFGAPGTGKTALARHIATTLGLQLHSKRASDLLDKYVGESERNIAQMFADAQKQCAILLLDEADSLLSDRSHASQQWEITQVNEMLTQMEDFTGIFICTTNLMDKLDAASLRRFDFKIKFNYLNYQQRWALFVQEFKRLGGQLPKQAEAIATLQQQIEQLTKLTPGDFAVVNRQASVLGKTPTPASVIAELTRECQAKGESFSRIGFVH